MFSASAFFGVRKVVCIQTKQALYIYNANLQEF